MSRRIERLEETFAPLRDPRPPVVLDIVFVGPQNNVVNAMVIELPPARPRKRRNWRAPPPPSVSTVIGREKETGEATKKSAGNQPGSVWETEASWLSP
jgi:hypothetical protein